MADESTMSEAGPGGTRAFVELRDLEVRFGGIRALDRVTFDVRAGEVLGVIGPNGAGKTTLFDVVAGARAPASGVVRLDGEDITHRSPTERARRGVRRTFQRVQTFGWLSVEDNVLSATEWRGGGGGFVGDVAGWPGRRRRERDRRALAAAAIDRCGLTSVRHQLAGSLPIGVARMVEFARAIVDAPRLLLLDEPASGLADTEIAQLGQLILQVRDETGCAVVLIEHDAPFVMRHCDRVVVLTEGYVLTEGTPFEVQHDPRVRDAYLGVGVEEGGAATGAQQV